uniref:Uncharacterized protein n=1 Tax=Nelumbo nucifera TaxID=4432 RepID=A0A822ZBJ4_NELNU|nr:TPA_asm: hypothetical protein HUJ06_015344 [Nelumbo nucifera]
MPPGSLLSRSFSSSTTGWIISFTSFSTFSTLLMRSFVIWVSLTISLVAFPTADTTFFSGPPSGSSPSTDSIISSASCATFPTASTAALNSPSILISYSHLSFQAGTSMDNVDRKIEHTQAGKGGLGGSSTGDCG